MSKTQEIDLRHVKPYGDTLNDGKVQMSFTLPIPYGDEAKEAARVLAKKMGFEEPEVVHYMDLGIGYTYFVIYGSCQHDVDYTSIEVPKVEVESMDKYGVEAYIDEHIKRDITIIGACTGTDAHTVGIDAIMNMKGFAGHYGLERYKHVNAINMGSQVPNEELIARAIEEKADALLVSQIVTQKNVHIPNLTQLIELLEAEGLRDKLVVVCGGPRLSHELAKELGYDAGFTTGSFANDVATFIVTEMVKRGL
jgi:beta-lysine 5,6-aminomutase beta subunit